jgi:3-oxoacyl-[acyl-carrier-protein] synthase-3
MTAAQVAQATGGRWTEQAVKESSLRPKPIPTSATARRSWGEGRAGRLKRSGYDPMRSTSSSHRRGVEGVPLTTSGIYIQERIGAKRPGTIVVQHAALAGRGDKMAKT